MLAALSATARDDGSPFDVLVIGGGVTGAGVAVDAASRGLSTAIVELDDWASGTSSRSSNLVHGGLRYLEMLDFRLVWEALHERDLLATRIAPHLVRPQRFLFPLRHRVWERLFIGAGILLYDLMATIRRGRRAMPWHRHVSRKAARERFPSIAHRSTVGAIEYWDATVDDAALVVSLVRTASRYGAVAVSRVRVVGYTTNESGEVNGVRAVDLETQESMEIRATRVIASTGVWTEETEAMTGETPTLEVLASKGAHIAVPRDRIDGDAALIIRTPTSVLFTIPSHSEWVIGTTDTPWDGDLRHPVATATDIDYLLDRVNAVLSAPLTRADVIGTWAGLRPLLQPTADLGVAPSKVSREHTVATPIPGLTVIAGGKLTTYRVMAKDVVDVALGSLARTNPSVTHDLAIVGAEGFAPAEETVREYAKVVEWHDDIVHRLLQRYGSGVVDLVAMCDDDPSLAKPLAGAPRRLRVEIVHAVTHEGALDLEDVLRRRTRIDREYPRHGIDVLDEVADLVAPLLGWTVAQRERSIAAYTALAGAEMSAADAPDDAAASEIMGGVVGPPMWAMPSPPTIPTPDRQRGGDSPGHPA